MYSSQSSSELFTRRSLLLGTAQIGLFALLVGRLGYLQLGQTGKYTKLSDGNRIKMRLILPNRGLIADRNGVILALNQKSFNVSILPEETPDAVRTLHKIMALVDIDPDSLPGLQKSLKSAPKFRPIQIKHHLSWEEVAKLEVHGSQLPGVLIEVGQSRFYPYGTDTAHVIGYVQGVSVKDKLEQEPDPMLGEPGMKIGKSGIERFADSRLRGLAGAVEKEVDALGRVVQELSRNSGAPGDTLPLTLDYELQKHAYELLGPKDSGSAVVIHIPTGDVLAAASHPSFDANLFVDGISRNNWNALRENTFLPLINRITHGLYPPGSIFKAIVALAGLERGLDPTRKIHCGGYSLVGSHKFHCWKHEHGHGAMNVTDALRESCDVYFYEIAREMGIDPIEAMARTFGLGAPTGIELPGEKSGLVPSKDWKLAHKGDIWSASDTLQSAIGQGFFQTTPIQLATMAARLGSSGMEVKPRLMGIETPTFQALPINPKNLEIVQAALAQVTNDPKGTGYRSRIIEPGFECAGKTSTVQVKRISLEERKKGILHDSARKWEDRDHGLFMGFGPISNPQFACVAVIDHGGKGSASAAPIAQALLLKAQKLWVKNKK